MSSQLQVLHVFHILEHTAIQKEKDGTYCILYVCVLYLLGYLPIG